jgi:hypothetical protein
MPSPPGQSHPVSRTRRAAWPNHAGVPEYTGDSARLAETGAHSPGGAHARSTFSRGGLYMYVETVGYPGRGELPELLQQVTTHVGEDHSYDVDAGLRALKTWMEQRSSRRVATDTDVKPLKRTPVWPGRTVPGGLDAAWRSALLQLGVDRHYERGDVMLGQGEVGTGILVLRTGQARVVVSTEDGERVVIGVRLAGEIVGKMSFVDRAPAAGLGGRVWAGGGAPAPVRAR